MNDHSDVQEQAANQPPDPEVAPWEQVEPGRFMPRRVRGSFRGQALG